MAVAALVVAIATSDASSNAAPKYLELSASAQDSSRSMFIDPVGSQSVPSAIETPAYFISVIGIVSPYRLMFERGAQTTFAPAARMAATSLALVPTACRTAVCDVTSPSAADVPQTISFSAPGLIPSAKCGA